MIGPASKQGGEFQAWTVSFQILGFASPHKVPQNFLTNQQ